LLEIGYEKITKDKSSIEIWYHPISGRLFVLRRDYMSNNGSKYRDMDQPTFQYVVGDTLERLEKNISDFTEVVVDISQKHVNHEIRLAAIEKENCDKERADSVKTEGKWRFRVASVGAWSVIIATLLTSLGALAVAIINKVG
jgi:hypothetical protein